MSFRCAWGINGTKLFLLYVYNISMNRYSFLLEQPMTVANDTVGCHQFKHHNEETRLEDYEIEHGLERSKCHT